MIFDTDVLIWYLRGNPKATETVIQSLPFSISIVTYIELLQGMRNKQEMMKMKKAFKQMKIRIIPINERISLRAAEFVEAYGLSNSMEMSDALIAATCIEENEALITGNDKHYKVIRNLQINIFRASA